MKVVDVQCGLVCQWGLWSMYEHGEDTRKSHIEGVLQR